MFGLGARRDEAHERAVREFEVLAEHLLKEPDCLHVASRRVTADQRLVTCSHQRDTLGKTLIVHALEQSNIPSLRSMVEYGREPLWWNRHIGQPADQVVERGR